MTNLPYQVVAIDLDGTLLPHHKEISSTSIDYLIRLQEKGVIVIVATGRNPKETFAISKSLRCVDFNGYLIACNGQLIHSFECGEDIEGTRVNQHEAKQLAKLGYKHKVMINVDNDEAFYQSKNSMGFAFSIGHILKNSYWIFNQISNRNIHRLNNIEDAINKDLRKICFAGNSNRLKKLSEEIEATYPQRFSHMLVSNNWLEIMEMGVSKGHALLTISELLNIPLDQFIAFGDGENDITMLKMVGHGVAMKNAMDSVKAIADDIAGRNDEDGVIRYLQKIGME